ncbi:hypothetical protein ACFL3F_01935 [Planctomycetota bacterium]
MMLFVFNGCKRKPSDALERAERAERKIAALEGTVASMQKEKSERQLSSLEADGELAQAQEDLLAAAQLVEELEAEKTDLEMKLKQALAFGESMRKKLADQDRDLQELDKLNRGLSEALDQLERQLETAVPIPDTAIEEEAIEVSNEP